MHRNLTLFIIDDDEDFLTFAREKINSLGLGIKINTFPNTKEARVALQKGEVCPFWCLCDISLYDDLYGAEELYIFLKEHGMSHLLTYWSEHPSVHDLRLSAVTGVDVLVKEDLFKNLSELAELVKTKIVENLGTRQGEDECQPE